MARLVRLPNGNVHLIREDGEEDLSLADVEEAAQVTDGVLLRNGNVWRPPEGTAAAEALRNEEPERVSGPKPKWNLGVSPMSYLRRHGLDAPRSADALALVGRSRADVERMLGLGEEKEPEDADEE